MSWVATCVVVFGAGALFGLALGLFAVGKVEGKPRSKNEGEEKIVLLEKVVTLLEARIDCLEKRELNQLKINENQDQINKFQTEMNEHLSNWIRKLSKKEK